jgi:glycosyltransferase involved in cell wall biosynthesis
MTLIEAALSRNLIVSSNFRGINPIFSENSGVLLFEKGNFQMLAEKLEYAIENYSKLNFQIDSLNKKVRDEFSIKKMVAGFKQFYRSILYASNRSYDHI